MIRCRDNALLVQLLRAAVAGFSFDAIQQATKLLNAPAKH
ncbi:hypothetical protein SynSYN20_00927 [Synechococcus sp. SYN20]|nr:hypothetical protein SynSYN20_00927 [Synechococcus sp. SYN20]